MSTVVDLKTKEEKDAELDRRIEALRKKNEALVRRYQEIEEDKKKAEQEGIAVKTHPPRKGRPHDGPPEGDRRKTEKENFTVTIDLSRPAMEKRVINEWKRGPPRGGRDSEEEDVPRQLDDSPPRRSGSGRLGRGGQRGGGPRQERREQRPDRPLADPRQAHERPPRDDQAPGPEGPGEVPGRGAPRGGRRGRGGRDGGGREGGGHEGGGREGGRDGGGGREGGRDGGGREGGGREGGRDGGGREGGGRGGREDGGGPQGGDRKSKEWEEKRRQNIEKMNEEMEKIAEYERGQRPTEGDKPIRNFLDDPRRSGPVPDMDRREGSRRHVRNWGGLDFDNVKTGSELEKEWTSRRPGGQKGSMDMTMSMTGRERAEYLRWKKEREEIDEERLARHRNATGQWRREWDAQKTDTMFKEDPAVAAEGMLPEKGGGRRDDVKRPPQAPTFGDFLGQGRGPREVERGERGERGRGRERGQRQSYSMHDNRWEGDEQEDHGEEKEKQDKPKKERTPKKEERKPKVSSSKKTEEKRSDAEEDDDEWSDVEEEEEDEGDSQSHQKAPPLNIPAGSTIAASPPASPQQSEASPPASALRSEASPKVQRLLKPKVKITSPPETSDSSEFPKPLSPFSPPDGHQPVTDWGEEMEMQSPRSSMGESPLKPPSTEGSPARAEVQEDGHDSSVDPGPSEAAEPDGDTQTVMVTAAPSEEIQETTVLSSSSSSEPVYTPTDPPEKEEAFTPPAQETLSAPADEPSEPDHDVAPAVLRADPSPPEPALAVETTSDTSEQPASG